MSRPSRLCAVILTNPVLSLRSTQWMCSISRYKALYFCVDYHNHKLHVCKSAQKQRGESFVRTKTICEGHSAFAGTIMSLLSVWFIFWFNNSLVLGPAGNGAELIDELTGVSVLSRSIRCCTTLSTTGVPCHMFPVCVSIFTHLSRYAKSSSGMVRSFLLVDFPKFIYFFFCVELVHFLVGAVRQLISNCISCRIKIRFLQGSISSIPLLTCTAHNIVFEWCMLGPLSQHWLSYILTNLPALHPYLLWEHKNSSQVECHLDRVR